MTTSGFLSTLRLVLSYN